VVLRGHIILIPSVVAIYKKENLSVGC